MVGDTLDIVAIRSDDCSMDRLDALLANKRKEEAALLKRLEEVRLVIDALEDETDQDGAPAPIKDWHDTLSDRPASNLGPPPTPPSKKGGRQKGAISNTWRMIFQEMVNSGHPNSPEEIRRFAFTVGLELTEKSARTRARDHLKSGYLEIRDDGYWVTNAAIRKFGLGVPK
jgi:hypothetical protein